MIKSLVLFTVKVKHKDCLTIKINHALLALMYILTLRNLLPHFDDKKATLAKYLGVSKQLISQWKPDEAIPELYRLKLQYELKPELFNADGSLKPLQPAAPLPLPKL